MRIRTHIHQRIIVLRLDPSVSCPEIAIVPHKEVLAVELRRLIRLIRKTAGHQEFMGSPLCLARKVQCIGKPSACALHHLMVDGIRRVLFSEDFRLVAQLLNQISEQWYLIIQAKLQRRKPG